MLVYFDAENHVYTCVVDGKEIELVSATTIASSVFPEFNKEEVSSRIAKGDEDKKRLLLDEWALASSLSINYGNAVHEAVQYKLTYNKDPKHPHLKLAVKEILKAVGEYDDIRSETTVASLEHKAAGTIDIITKKDGKYTLWDIKTSTDIHKSQGNIHNGVFKGFKNTKLLLYSVQLGIYTLLFEHQYGKEISSRKLILWDGKKAEVTTAIKIEKDVIEEIIKNYHEIH